MFSHCRALSQPVPALAPLGQTISSSLYRQSHFHTKESSRLRVKGESGCKSPFLLPAPSPEQGEGFCGICTAPWQGFDVFEASSCYFRASLIQNTIRRGKGPANRVFLSIKLILLSPCFVDGSKAQSLMSCLHGKAVWGFHSLLRIFSWSQISFMPRVRSL